MSGRKSDHQLKVRTDARFDVQSCLALRVDHGYTLQQIADHFTAKNIRDGVPVEKATVTRQAVWTRLRRFQRFLGDPSAVKAFSDHEPLLLDAARAKLLANMMEEGRLKKASVNNLAFAFTQLNVAARLHRQQSTSNVSVRSEVVIAAHKERLAARTTPTSTK